MFFDLEKAFDFIDWMYMTLVLQRMGFGPTFLKWISLLYEHPVAALRINGGVSDIFPVSRGTRQGCHPFTRTIHTGYVASGNCVVLISPNTGDQRGYSPFMWMTWYYLFRTRNPPCRLHCCFWAGNWTKILPLHSHPMPVQVDPNNPLQWVTQIKYLGLIITNTMTDFIGLNISPLLPILNRKLHTWKNLSLSLIGKVNLIKMKILPLFLYILILIHPVDPQINFEVNCQHALLFYGMEGFPTLNWPCYNSRGGRGPSGA